MKSYTLPELRTFVARLGRDLEGAQLQEVRSNDRGLALGFFARGMTWLVLDLTPHQPLALLIEDESPFPKTSAQKPVGLFLNSHGRNRRLRDPELLEAQGRVFRFHLDDSAEVEVHLIPKQVNLFVRAAVDGKKKQISWEKPRELISPPLIAEFPAERELDEIRDGWLAELKGPAKSAQDPEAQWRKKRDRDLEKKKKALSEVEDQLARDEAREWARRAEAYREGGGEPVDAKKNFAWNLDQMFQKSKQAKAKRQGTEERVILMREEIQRLQAETFEAHLEKKQEMKHKPRKGAFLEKAQVRARTLQLEDDLVAYIGRSATDNLNILRKSRAWDLWMHLRDYPGAHAVIHRRKDQNVSDAILRQVSQWLARESLGSKIVTEGVRLEVVWTECRHVKPIKGDRLGRVNYHHEKHFQIELKS